MSCGVACTARREEISNAEQCRKSRENISLRASQTFELQERPSPVAITLHPSSPSLTVKADTTKDISRMPSLSKVVMQGPRYPQDKIHS